MKQFARRRSQRSRPGSAGSSPDKRAPLRAPASGSDPYAFLGEEELLPNGQQPRLGSAPPALSDEQGEADQEPQHSPPKRLKAAPGPTAGGGHAAGAESAAGEAAGAAAAATGAGVAAEAAAAAEAAGGSAGGKPAQPGGRPRGAANGQAKSSGGRPRGAASGGGKAAAASGAGKQPTAAASGGSSKAGGGAKRARPPPSSGAANGGQQPQQAGCTTPIGRTSSSGSGGAVTLPTPRRPAGLVAASLLSAVANEGRPAQTVMEAQERGEQVQMQDDARYAMDGLLPSSSLDTQRDSAAALADMLSSRRGRAALRAEGLAQQFLTALAKLKASKDAVLGLAATLALLSLTADDANPCYLASVAAGVLIDQLLQSDHTFEEAAACSPAGAKLLRFVRGRALAGLLASTEVNSQRGLLLVALEQATSSNQASKAAGVEKLKHNLRSYGGLARLAQLVADAGAAPGGALGGSRQLHLVLLVLENATFSCPENGAALVGLQVQWPAAAAAAAAAARAGAQPDQGAGGSGGSGSGSGGSAPFPAVLVAVARQLLGGLAQDAPRAALHCCLSVLMNLSHQNPAGGALISSAGGLDVASATLEALLAPAAGSHAALCGALLQHLELLSVSLGLLINLVSGEPQHSVQLAGGGQAPAPQPPAAPEEQRPAGGRASRRRGAGACAGGSGSGGSQQQLEQAQLDAQPQQAAGDDLVQLLCAVMTAVGQLLQRDAGQAQAQQDEAMQEPGAGGAAAPEPPTGAAAAGGGAAPGAPAAPAADSPGGLPGGVAGDDDSRAGEASIVEVYCGMLLGFLVRDCGPALAARVAGLLAGGSLAPLTSAVERCLGFYVQTGAITDHTRDTLQALLQHLASCHGDGGAGGAAGSPMAVE